VPFGYLGAGKRSYKLVVQAISYRFLLLLANYRPPL
jgi:hypothetical protein